MLRLGTLLLVLRRVLLGGEVGLRWYWAPGNRLVLGRELGLPSVVLGREVGLQGLVLGGQVGLPGWDLDLHVFCSDANGGPLFLLTDGSVLMNESAGGYGTRRWWKLTPIRRQLRQRKLDARGRQQRRAEVLRIRRARRRQAPCLRRRVQRLERHQPQDDTAASEIYDPVATLGRSWPRPRRRPSSATRRVACSRRAFPARQLQQHLDVPARSRNGQLDDRGRERRKGRQRLGGDMGTDGGRHRRRAAVRQAPNAEMYVVSNDQWKAGRDPRRRTSWKDRPSRSGPACC